MNQMRPRLSLKLLTPVALVLVSSITALVLCESIARRVKYSAADRARGPMALWARYNIAFQLPLETTGCAFSDRVQPHPYLGYADKFDFTACGQSFAKSRGIDSRYEYPVERDKDHFSLLILGGSVAHYLGMGSWQGRIWLEEYLNAHYRSPNGKPFRVYNGAAGGWRLPNQNIVMTLYGDAFDAFVSVDGYNETMNTQGGAAIDYVPAALYVYLTNPPDAPWGLRAIWWLNEYRSLCVRSAVLRRSFLAYMVFDAALSRLNDNESYNAFVDQHAGRYFRLPQSWEPAKRIQWNRKKYATYIQLQAAQAHALNSLYAHFVQPVHEMGKTLSEEEKHLPSLITAKAYDDVVIPGSEDARRAGAPSFLLVDVFKDVKETVYADEVHCRFDAQGESRGFELISDRIGELLGTAWRLKPRLSRITAR